MNRDKERSNPKEVVLFVPIIRVMYFQENYCIDWKECFSQRGSSLGYLPIIRYIKKQRTQKKNIPKENAREYFIEDESKHNSFSQPGKF